ncbi:EexN family lipoprotein [Parashewanella tropica]|uniref:EexN family lipoprotein n=1 Tax=Parashewanella tropica TaxID=2547970 RepID=UPI00105953D1|nr:EexN family lipoprotein [Parashewanella tropica]
MKLQYLPIIAIGSLALSACFDGKHSNNDSLQAHHNVSWFLAHDKLLNSILKQCADDPARYKNNPECINALQAANQQSSGELQPLHIDVSKLPKHHGWN